LSVITSLSVYTDFLTGSVDGRYSVQKIT